MKKLDLQPNTPEWLEARSNYRTASEAAIVCGVSPFTTPEKFKLIKAGLVKQYYSAAMRRGHDLEDKTRQWASVLLHRDFKEEVWVNGEYLASLDGIDGDILIEIKTSDFTYHHIKEGHVEEHYWLQIQQQLACSPASIGFLVAYSPKKDAFAISDPIEPDASAMVRIAAAWEQFDAMPLPEGNLDLSDNIDLRLLFERYTTLKHEADRISEEMAEVKATLLSYAPERTVDCNGNQILFRKGATRVDYKSACTDHKIDLEPYQEESAPTYSIKLAPSPFEAEE
jgi:putative phage-type endonuclease